MKAQVSIYVIKSKRQSCNDRDRKVPFFSGILETIKENNRKLRLASWEKVLFKVQLG